MIRFAAWIGWIGLALMPCGAVAAQTAAAAQTQRFDHSDWTAVLQAHVNDRGLVDYPALAGDRTAFDRYLTAIAKQGPQTTPELFPTRDDALAFYINGYNALVFQGVLARGTGEGPVWRGALSGLKFFILDKYEIDGETTGLKRLEDKWIREEFGDPRIHAALNCAALGCPRLRREAYTGSRLDAQLDEAFGEFVNDPRHVRVDATQERIYLSKIFDWFEDDFVDAERRRGASDPSTLGYINRFRAPDARLATDWKVEILPYDKGINRSGSATD